MRASLISGCLAALFLICGCGRTPVSGISVDPAFRTLIAPDTKLLAGLDLDALKASPFYQRHQKELNIPLFNATAERMGVDPLRDVSNLVAEWNGEQWLFLERGRFNAADLQNKLIANGMRSTTYGGKTLLGDARTALVLFKSVAAEGPKTLVQQAIDLENAGRGEVPEELQERLRTLSSHDQIWAVNRGGLAFADMPMNSDWQSALSNITASISGTTAGVYVDTGVHLSINLQCVSDQGATRVHDGLRGAIGFGRLSTKDDQEDVLRAYDAIQVNKVNQIVQVRADLPANLADQLITTLTSFTSRH